MQDAYQSLLLPDVRQWAIENDTASMAEFCALVHPAIAAGILEELTAEQVWRILECAEVERRVEIFEYIELPKQEELVEKLDRKSLSNLIENMSADDRVDLLSRMTQERVDDLLPLIAQAERNDIRKLLSYDPETAGAIMTTDYASLPADITASEALQRLRQQAPDSETIYYIYILNDRRRLEGLVSLRELILAKPNAKLKDIMQTKPIHVSVSDDREYAVQELARYNFIAMPVVDSEERLVGIITHDDALDVAKEEAIEDAYLQSAVQPMDDDYEDTPLLTILWKRGVWLLFLSFVALMTAKVLDQYRESTSEGGARAGETSVDLTKFILLFLPLVMASGGNAGSQSATLFIRTFAVKRSGRHDSGGDAGSTRRLTIREFAVALCLGGALCSVDFLAAYFWFGMNAREAGVIASTVLLVVLLGTSCGALLPQLFRRLHMDPAIMSNPLIAAIVDVVGVVIFYEVALSLL